MIYLKLRQAGSRVNHKRVDRQYAEVILQVRGRKHKKVPVCDRQPLLQPPESNEDWSMDFVFDHTAKGRVIKCLTIIDDATNELVAIVTQCAMGGEPLTRILDRLGFQRGLQLRQTQLGELNQNAYIELFNGRFRDECLNKHFMTLAHAKEIIETWRNEYNE